MSVPTIAIINFSSQLSDEDVQQAVRAVNRQVFEDFAPIWGSARALRLFAASFDPAHPDALSEEPVRGDSVLYIVDEATLPGALGYHDLNTGAIPVGFVFAQDPTDWTTTLSHEVLELIEDPTVNILVPGPHPNDPNNTVLHAYEVCDAVERTGYLVDGVRVSNFLTPEYFTAGDELGTRNDFLGVGVPSFGVTEGSHIAFFNLDTNDWEEVFGTMKPERPLFGRRVEAFCHDKPRRPSEEQLDSILNEYQAKQHPRKCSGLPRMQAITRMGRYKATGISLKRTRR